MNIENYIRSLARSSYYQQIYRSSKECNGISLFENSTDISGLQSIFLYWLKVYDMIYNELANKDWSNLDLDVINDDDRLTAFIYWRSKEIEKENYKQKKEEKKSKMKAGQRSFNIYKGGK